MSFKIILVLVAAVLVAVYAAATPLIKQKEESEDQLSTNNELKKKCQCMPWKFCDGEVDNDVECHPSFSHICCIRPDPEPIPPYVAGTGKNFIADIIQVFRV